MRPARRDASRHPGPPENVRRLLAENLFSPLNGITLSDWTGLLARRAFQVAPRYWPRAAFTSVMAAVNSTAAALERTRFAEAVEAAPVRAPVFVLGHHRNGTTHLWNLLSQDERFAFPSILQAIFPHSFLVFENAIRGLAERLTIRKRPQDNVEMDQDSPIEEERAICTSTFLSMQMARHFPRQEREFRPYLTLRDVPEVERERWKTAFSRFARKLVVRHGHDKTLLFKSPDHTGKIRTLLEVFPDARFVHIHRDPFVVYASTLHMETRTQPVYAFHTWPDPERLKAFVLWRYRAMYDAYFEDIKALRPGQIVELGFADLEQDPVGALDRIYRGLGLEVSEAAETEMARYLERLSGYRKTAHARLDEVTRARVVQAWRPVFERYGYSTS